MPNEDFKIEGIKGVSKSADMGAADLDASGQVSSTKERFDSFMQQESKVDNQLAKPEALVDEVQKPTPMDEVRRLNYKVEAIARASPETIKAKADELVAEIDSIHKKYSQFTQTDIKTSFQTLLKNRLSHIDDTLKIALSKVGLEHISPESQSTKNPIVVFLNSLSHGQDQLGRIGDSINQMQAKGINLNPVDMLAIQVNMHQIQQQLEFCTNCLNKALESTKTLMNVQV